LKLWWIEFIYRRTMPCKEAMRLLSQGQDRPLSLGARMKLRCHYLICVYCERYGRQLQFMRRAAPELGEKPPQLAGALMPEAMKQQLKQRLRRESK
jgi:hypothetical protein